MDGEPDKNPEGEINNGPEEAENEEQMPMDNNPEEGGINPEEDGEGQMNPQESGEGNENQDDGGDYNPQESQEENMEGNYAEGEEEAHNEDEALYDYDENEDFPVFANETNKRLNQVIKGYKDELHNLNKEIETDSEMIKILKVHTQSVENQVNKREKMLEEMTNNVDHQTHTIEIVKRQIGKVKSQRKELENKEQSLQERFNNLQQNISAANEKMDSYKLNMKNILEELEQWAMAARQKEDDKMHIEQYYRIDELHIKDIMLQIEKLTQEVNIKMHELEKEVTETQARQIEMEKTTEELKKLQIERQRLLDDVMRTQETIKILSDELRRQCDIYFTNKVELGEQKESLEKKVKEYDERVKSNKQEEEENKKQEAKLSKSRGDLVKLEKDFNEIHNEIEIKKNELSALARELTNKTNYTNVIKNDLEKKRKSLDEAKSEYQNKKVEIEINEEKDKTAKGREEGILKENQELKAKMKKVKDDLDRQVKNLYEQSKLLFGEREKEATLIGSINNNISAKKNLKANINKLDNEIQKQGELVYNIDFQIQLMERKVDWVQGKRTQEETKEINKKTEILEKQVSDLQKNKERVEDSLTMIQEDLRKVNMKLKNTQEEDEKLTSIIEELELENLRSSEDLQKKVKQKEEILVEHDLMKLDIKKIYDTLIHEANNVFSQENKLAQLELAIKEREKQINVHKDILVAEHKSAEEERHKAATELSLKATRAKNLKLKYESLVQKTKGDESEEKYSQAYYVIKTAQEKEELQRQVDEMQGKIAKCRKDYYSLRATLKALNERNDKFKKALILKKNGDVDRSKLSSLNQKFEKENKEMWDKKKELEDLNSRIRNNEMEREQWNEQVEQMKISIGNYESLLNKQKEDAKKKEESSNRAINKFNKTLKDKNIKLDGTNIGLAITLNNEKLKNKFLKNAIVILSNEIEDIKDAFTGELQSELNIPSRPISSKASSQVSHESSFNQSAAAA